MTDIRRSLLRGMSSIVSDLYGEPASKTATYKTVDTVQHIKNRLNIGDKFIFS
jgi:hypothetical protein